MRIIAEGQRVGKREKIERGEYELEINEIKDKGKKRQRIRGAIKEVNKSKERRQKRTAVIFEPHQKISIH